MSQKIVSAAEHLEIHTQVYWEISRAFHGRGSNIASGSALTMCGDSLQCIGPDRRLKGKMSKLQHTIIMGRGRKKKIVLKNNIHHIQLKKA